jgi:hypothetical protein
LPAAGIQGRLRALRLLSAKSQIGAPRDGRDTHLLHAGDRSATDRMRDSSATAISGYGEQQSVDDIDDNLLSLVQARERRTFRSPQVETSFPP